MKFSKWGLGAIGLAVAGVVAAGALTLGGSAQAQTPGDKAGRYNELLAQKLGISVSQLETAEKAARDQLIDEAVTAGRITADQAAKLKERPVGEGPRLGGLGKAAGARVLHDVVQASANVIGIDVAKVRDGLKNGQSLSQIAANNGKSRDALKSGLTSALQADIQQAQVNGTITSQQADRLRQGLSDHIDQIIDHQGGMKGAGFRRGP